MKAADIDLMNSIRINSYEQAMQYLTIMRQVNSCVNLYSSKLPLNKLLRYVMRSVELYLTILQSHPKCSTILDIGSGNGLPGIILGILGTRVIMVDSNIKKCAFLTLIVSKLHLDAKIINSRIEEIDTMQVCTNEDNRIIITASAFSRVKKLISICMESFELSNIEIFLLKGENVANEIDEASEKFTFQSSIIHSAYDARSTILILKNISSK
ncbi:Ribosomal RNA small subunit methyltransferase G [Candidatus Fokinia solitaria]|uniref:Ribosomal RNA small subunit methyltransferase G n=1 Tax=Candidatus Fokinia solitaria TaxID=1802984 RepID=A0A2U8BRP5_9RICK|nr:RsmG family class I SAM-dependent methyltransferase [Candidatus Fokinia solitaria]AWD33015.1 Ribosomal RNA small subunit methyltransferase G [Candidatus Fokinia solitaria]